MAIDPGSIDPLSVLVCSDLFQYDPESKFLVALWHENSYLICLKPTSQTDFYESNAEMAEGCICYAPGAVSCFPKKTYIDPDNLVHLSHLKIFQDSATGKFKIVGTLPGEFLNQLEVAVRANIRMTPREQANLIGGIRKIQTAANSKKIESAIPKNAAPIQPEGPAGAD